MKTVTTTNHQDPSITGEINSLTKMQDLQMFINILTETTNLMQTRKLASLTTGGAPRHPIPLANKLMSKMYQKLFRNANNLMILT